VRGEHDHEVIRAKHDYKIVRKESKITWNHKKCGHGHNLFDHLMTRKTCQLKQHKRQP
jgi:hypothetical protein